MLFERFRSIPRTVLVIAAVSGALRLALLVVTPMAEPDQYEQVVIARNAVNGFGFDMAWPYTSADSARADRWSKAPPPHPSAFMPPFVPAFYTCVFQVAGTDTIGIFTALVIQALIGAFIPILVYRIARRLGTHRGSLLAAGCSLIYLPGLLSSATPSGAVWYGLFGLLVVDSLQKVLIDGRPVWSLGVYLGVLALMRSEFLLLGLACCALPLLKKNWRMSIITATVMMAVVSPWLIRNAIVFERPTNIITHPWREVWRGANAYASGSGYASDGYNIWEGDRYPHVVRKLDSIPVTKSFEHDADLVFKSEVLQFVKQDPWRWIALAGKKMVMLWSIDPYYPKARNVAYVVPTLITSSLILLGCIVALTMWRRLDRARLMIMPLGLIGLSLTLLFGITYVLPRYQTYVFTIMMPMAVFAFDWMMSRFRTKEQR